MSRYPLDQRTMKGLKTRQRELGDRIDVNRRNDETLSGSRKDGVSETWTVKETNPLQTGFPQPTELASVMNPETNLQCLQENYFFSVLFGEIINNLRAYLTS